MHTYNVIMHGYSPNYGSRDQVNQYIDNNKPWVLAKEPERLNEVQAICTMGLNLFRVLMTYLKPVIPQMAVAAENVFKL